MVVYLSFLQGMFGLLVKWSRRRPLTAKAGVRLPYGSPANSLNAWLRLFLFLPYILMCILKNGFVILKKTLCEPPGSRKIKKALIKSAFIFIKRYYNTR